MIGYTISFFFRKYKSSSFKNHCPNNTGLNDIWHFPGLRALKKKMCVGLTIIAMHFNHPLLRLHKNPWFVQFMQGQMQHLWHNVFSGVNQKAIDQSKVQRSGGCERHSMCLIVKFKPAIPQWSHYTPRINSECPDTCLKEMFYVGLSTRMIMFVTISYI